MRFACIDVIVEERDFHSCLISGLQVGIDTYLIPVPAAARCS